MFIEIFKCRGHFAGWKIMVTPGIPLSYIILYLYELYLIGSLVMRIPRIPFKNRATKTLGSNLHENQNSKNIILNIFHQQKCNFRKHQKFYEEHPSEIPFVLP